MKGKFILFAVVVFMLGLIAFANAYEREQFSVDELTVNKILTPSGGRFLGYTSGDDRYVKLGGSNMTGPIKQRSGKAPYFINVTSGTSVTVNGVRFTVRTSTVYGARGHILTAP